MHTPREPAVSVHAFWAGARASVLLKGIISRVISSKKGWILFPSLCVGSEPCATLDSGIMKYPSSACSPVAGDTESKYLDMLGISVWAMIVSCESKWFLYMFKIARFYMLIMKDYGSRNRKRVFPYTRVFDVAPAF